MVDWPLTFKCNNNCLSCIYNMEMVDKLKMGNPREEHIRNVIGNVKGGETLGLTGGEPTIRKEFFRILKYARGENPQINLFIVSNGRMFYYREFVEKMFNIGLENLKIGIALYGHTKEIHDAITRIPGSFEQTVQGIRNLLGLGYNPDKIIVNTVITKQNMKYLEDIADFVMNDLKLPRTKFSFMEIEGNALKNIEKLLPRFKETYSFLEGVAKHAGKLNKRIIIEKGPLCLCPDISNVSYIFEKVLIDTERFIKPDSCSACPSNEKCQGIHKNYTKLYSLDELEKKETSKLRILFGG